MSKPKLVLKAETVRSLTSETLALVRGGTFATENCPSNGMPCVKSQYPWQCRKNPDPPGPFPRSLFGCPKQGGAE